MKKLLRNLALISVALAWIGFAGPIVETGYQFSWLVKNIKHLQFRIVYPVFAQSCNDPAGFIKSRGTFALGDTVIFGPDCETIQSGGQSSLSITTPNIATLRAISPPSVSTSIFVTGYYGPGDGGSGWFYYNTLSTAADNAGTIIIPSSAPAAGRWLRNLSVGSYYLAQWFGARCNSVSDDGPIIRAMILNTNTNGAEYKFPSGACLSSVNAFPILNNTAVKITGNSANNNAASGGSAVVFTGATGSLMTLDGVGGFEFSNMTFTYNNPSYNADLIDAREVIGGVLSNTIVFRNFNLAGTPGVATGARSLIRVGNTLNLHMYDAFMQLAQRGIYTDGTLPVNTVNIHDIWFQNFSVVPIVEGNGENWNIHDNIAEPLTSGATGFIAGVGARCVGCAISTNGVQDGNNTGTAVDFSGGGYFSGGTISANVFQGGFTSDLGISNNTVIQGNIFVASFATGFLKGNSASFLDVRNNRADTNAGPSIGLIFTAAGFPSNSFYDNNDGTGLHISTTPLGADSGGTGYNSYTIGDILVAGSSFAFSKLNDAALNSVLCSGGIGATPFYCKVANAAMINSAVTINGTSVSLGGAITVPAAPSGAAGGDLTGTYPNPIILAGAVTLGKITAVNANTVFANASSISASPTAFAMPSCSASASALIWTTNTGFGCNASFVAQANLGTGVYASLQTNNGLAGAFVVYNGNMGKPTSGDLTNASSLPISSGVSGLGTGVATALAASPNASGGFVTFNGNFGAATGTSAKLGGSAMGALVSIDQAGGETFNVRFNSGNPRFGINIGASSGTAFLSNNLVWSGSGNVFNFDKTGTAAIFGNLAGASDANYLCGATGTAGASSSFDTGLGCGIAITTTGELNFIFGGVPTIASGACGALANGTVSGSNQSGIVTIGASATTTCTISFSRTLARAPAACVTTPHNAAAAATGTTVAFVSSTSTTNWVITGTVLAGTSYYYHCI